MCALEKEVCLEEAGVRKGGLSYLEHDVLDILGANTASAEHSEATLHEKD